MSYNAKHLDDKQLQSFIRKQVEYHYVFSHDLTRLKTLAGGLLVSMETLSPSAGVSKLVELHNSGAKVVVDAK